MKKVFCCLLILSVILQTTVFAEKNSDISVDMELLKILKIVKTTDDIGEFITRGEAAVYLARMMDITLAESDNTSDFLDLQSDSTVCDAVCKLSNLSIVRGNGTGNYFPNENIRKVDAISLFLRSMGFTQEIFGFDDYLTGNINLSKKIGIYINDGRNDIEPITSDVFFQIMMKVLECDMVVLTGGQGGQITYKVSNEENILSKYHDIRHGRGIVSANSLFSITGGDKTAAGRIEIDGKVYSENYFVDPLIVGSVVDYYIYNEESLIYLTQSNRNKSLTISSDDINSYSAGVYSYNVRGASKRVKFDYTSIPIVYNYKLLMSYSESLLKPECGYVTLVDNNGDNNYDVLFVMSYKNFFVSGIVTDDDKLYVYDENELNKKPLIISLDDSSKTIIEDSSGNTIDAKSIKKDCVVSAFAHEETSGYEAQLVRISRNTVSGMINGINSDDESTNLPVITIDEKKYSLYGNISQNDLEVGKSFVFFLDFNDRISGINIDRPNSDMGIGYIISSKYIAKEDGVRIKLLTELGKIQKYYCNKKVRISGDTSKKDGTELSTFLAGKTGIVGYKLNEEGRINYLSFPTDWQDGKKNGEIFNVFSNQSLYYFGGSRRSFYNRYVISPKATVFNIPDNEDDEDYLVTTPDKLLVHAETYTVDGYMLATNSTQLDVVVVHTNTAGSTSISGESEGNTISVVQSIVTKLNEYDEIVKEMTLIGMNGKVTYTLKNDSVMDMNNIIPGRTGNVSEGDVIRYAVNYKNEIDLIQVVYDASEDDFSGTTALFANYGAKSRPVVGKIYNYSDNTVVITGETTPINSSLKFEDMESYPVGNAVIIVYDKNEVKKNRVRTGKTSDFISYKMASSNCSRVLVDSYQGTARVFVILK